MNDNQQATANAPGEQALRDQFKAIMDNYKRDCRKQALLVAHQINPIQSDYNGLTDVTQKTKPSIETILSDADEIYQWLTKFV